MGISVYSAAKQTLVVVIADFTLQMEQAISNTEGLTLLSSWGVGGVQPAAICCSISYTFAKKKKKKRKIYWRKDAKSALFKTDSSSVTASE